jgi:SET and MYND domain-containing protein
LNLSKLFHDCYLFASSFSHQLGISQSCWQRAWDTGHLYECGLLAGAPYELDIRMLYRILILLRKKVLLPEQVRALARLAHEQDKYKDFSSDWQGVKDIAAEAKQRMKSELDVADVLKLYCLVSQLPVHIISGTCKEEANRISVFLFVD